MPELAKETVALLTFLLPGFLVAWVLYALTSLQKPVQVERVIQALVFTLFVKALVLGLKSFLELLGTVRAFRPWDESSELVASLLVALVLGFCGSYLVNKGTLHQFLRRKKISTRSSQPSEWCDVFCRYQLFVTLHFKDDRRLYGWPEEWPSDPEKGHFFIVLPVWTHDTTPTPMTGVEGVLINVTDVRFVEFVQ